MLTLHRPLPDGGACSLTRAGGVARFWNKSQVRLQGAVKGGELSYETHAEPVKLCILMDWVAPEDQPKERATSLRGHSTLMAHTHISSTGSVRSRRL